MGLFDSLSISATGLTAERTRMDVTAENLANAQTTRAADGGPYKRKSVVLQEGGTGLAGGGFAGALNGAMGSSANTQGVAIAGITEDSAKPKMVYDPGHPDANKQGYVAMPNVDPVTEMVDMIGSSRAYEANVTAMQTAKSMFAKTLDILK